MGREIRRVPPNWEHPKYERGEPRPGDYKPMFNRSYLDALNEWIDEHNRWEVGQHPHQDPGYRFYAQYGGNPPDVEYYRPEWKEGEATWFQVYETVSEGTPVSPPFATKEELVEYLVANGDFWDQRRGHRAWPRANAEKFVGIGWAPTGIFTPGVGFQTGIEALGEAGKA